MDVWEIRTSMHIAKVQNKLVILQKNLHIFQFVDIYLHSSA